MTLTKTIQAEITHLEPTMKQYVNTISNSKYTVYPKCY